MASVNKAIILGNLGQDPETRYMPNGKAATNITIATTESWKDKEGNKQEKTEWHRVTFFDRLAEVAGEYLKKGSPVYVEGRIQSRKWQDKEGVDRYTTEIIADRMQLLGGKSKDEPPKKEYDGKGGFGDFDDDVPLANSYKGRWIHVV